MFSNHDYVFQDNDALGLAPYTTQTSSSLPNAPSPSLASSYRREPSTLSARRGSAHALPNFIFNPSSSSSQPFSTPPQSPQLVVPITPPRIIGHRRGGSEYVGGDGNGGGGLKSASPTKGEAALPVPESGTRHGPPAGRRGHAHRRSAAMSSHDLSDIVKPKEPPLPVRHGSAPVSPVESSWPSPATAQASESLSSVVASSSVGVDSESSSPRSRAVPRVRVGFSERVEYIRPLSTISSETESSISTVRQGGHSVSNSFSSLMSASSPSPPASRAARGPLQAPIEEPSPARRPSTAGAILEKSHKGDVSLNVRPSTAEVNGNFADRYSKNLSLSKARSSNNLNDKSGTKKKLRGLLNHRRSEPALSSTEGSSENESLPDSPLLTHPVSPASSDEMFRQAKSKGWSGLISRKVKSQEFKSKAGSKSSTENTELGNATAKEKSEASIDAFTPDFDSDNTVTIVSESASATKETVVAVQDSRYLGFTDEGEERSELSPVIDLDVADESTQAFGVSAGSSRSATGFANARRRMRSGGGLAPAAIGINRLQSRAQSAPELAPFESKHPTSVMTSTMADVFEEEEDAELTEGMVRISQAKSGTVAQEKRPATASAENGDSSKVNDGGNIALEGTAVRSDLVFGKVSRKDDRPSALEKSRQSVSEPVSSTINHGNALGVVEVVEDYEEPRASSINRSSDSTISALAPGDGSARKEGTVDLTITLPPPPIMTPDSFTASSFSSPEFARSQASFDTPRLGTAASSMTDHRIHSIASASVGELRMSVEDVPSLISSRSTATTGVRNSLPTLHSRYVEDQRSSRSYTHSVSSEQRSKRSSIVSLSRLVGGSFAEKSKLSVEQKPQVEKVVEVKEAKVSRSKRLSRLMGFWKSKERLRQ